MRTTAPPSAGENPLSRIGCREKAGFRQEGTMCESGFTEGTPQDLHRRESILRPEYEKHG